MSVPKHIYLGNILGATGPIGPKGETGYGCPQCATFDPVDIYFLSPTLSFDFHNQSNDLSCWKTNQGATVHGRLTNGSFTSEFLYVHSADISFSKLTFNTNKFYDKNHPITVCHGNNIGPTGPSGGPIGATGPIGPSGERGLDCKGCFGVSNSNLDLNSPSTAPGEKVIITVDQNLSCLDGTRIRVHDRDTNSTSFLEGTIYSYINDKLTFTVDYRNGVSNSSSWNFGIAGIIGATGPGLVGPAMTLSAEDRQVIYNNFGEAKGANLFYRSSFNELGEEENRLGILTAYPEETLDISGSLKIRNVEPIIWPYS